MLYIIGAGVSDERGLSVRAVDVLRKCELVYLENYTSVAGFKIADLERLIGKKIVLASREMVEGNDSEIVAKAKSSGVGFIVLGDVFAATTHSDIYLRCVESGVEVIHNASIFNVISDSGLSLYKFGRTASIPFENSGVESPYDALAENKDLHTLFLLDIRDGKTMTFSEGIEYLLRIGRKRGEGLFSGDSLCVGCCALGTSRAKTVFGKASDLVKLKLDIYPQCLVVVGKLHFIEEEILKRFRV